MTKEQINEYSVRISQSTKTELVAISCEVAVQYMKDAIGVLDTDKKKFSFYIKNAMKFVDDLTRSLDLKYEISGNLLRLYLYVKRILIHSNAVYTSEGLADAIKVMSQIGQAFEKVAEQDVKRERAMSGSQTIYSGFTYGRNSMPNEYIV